MKLSHKTQRGGEIQQSVMLWIRVTPANFQTCAAKGRNSQKKMPMTRFCRNEAISARLNRRRESEMSQGLDQS